MGKLHPIILITIILLTLHQSAVSLIPEIGVITLGVYYPKVARYADLFLREIKGIKNDVEKPDPVLERMQRIKVNQKSLSITLGEIKKAVENLEHRGILKNNINSINIAITRIHADKNDAEYIFSQMDKSWKDNPDQLWVQKLQEVAESSNEQLRKIVGLLWWPMKKIVF